MDIMTHKRYQVVVTDIGEYVEQHCCERSFKLRLDRGDVARRFPFYGRVRSPLNPILTLRGREREDEVERTMRARLVPLNRPGEERMTWSDLLDRLGQHPPGTDMFAREVEIERAVGEFDLSGRMDFVILRWVEGAPTLRIVECKSSRKDKTYHRIQLAAYRIMVTEALGEQGLTIGGRTYRDVAVESVVARIDPLTNKVQDALALPSLGLVEEVGDLRNLLSPEGPLVRIAGTDLEELCYRLEAKCSACVHCPICLPESARRRRLELLGLDPMEVRALTRAGITSIDELADLDPVGPLAQEVRRTVGFGADLNDLMVRAKARRSTMADSRSGDWGVMSRRRPGLGLLPSHQAEGGDRLVRVFLDVEYDYIEDRVVGLAAHVTESERSLLMPFAADRTPDPNLRETLAKEDEGTEVQAREVVRLALMPWSGETVVDDASERDLIASFLEELVDAIVQVGGSGWRPLHFYVWSQGDMGHLIDACYRCGGPLLHDLTELLGCRAECRADLEQMIFTSLADEVDQQVATGYTGLSPVIATTLSWFGYPRFHWTRKVEGRVTDLSYVMRRDLFDFRAPLARDPEGEWTDRDAPGARSEFYEVRTYFSSEVNAPYWYAMWGVLPAAEGRDNLLPRALEDYRRGGTAPVISAFLLAKCQALRWIEERLHHNDRIDKPPVPLGELRGIGSRFTSRYDLVESSLDFLRLDHHVKRSTWLIESLRPPSSRVSDGSCLPLRDIFTFEENGRCYMGGTIDLERFSLEPQVYFSSCTLDEGGFVRISPYSGDIHGRQRFRDVVTMGVTAKVEVLDRDRGAFKAVIIPHNRQDPTSVRYLLPSYPKSVENMSLALVGESLANFARARVDGWLSVHGGSPIVGWFDPQGPRAPSRVPPGADVRARFHAVLGSLEVDGHHLDEVQVRSCIEGLSCTVQLLLGPPGTGKTNTAAAAILLRLAARRKRKLFLVSANTHTAVDELVKRLRSVIPAFRRAADQLGLGYNAPRVLRLTNEDVADDEQEVGTWNDDRVRTEMEQGDVVLCGTVAELLKVAERFERIGPFAVDGLVVDEASMMVFPDFLALATLLAEDGEIMLVGDHLQLSPITAHAWEEESREQVRLLLPHESAYRTVDRLSALVPSSVIGRSALTITYRLTPELTHLISGVYRAEQVELRSRKVQDEKRGAISSLSDLWREKGVFLVLHDESRSRRSNLFEARLIHDILRARGVEEHEVPPGTVSVITPHRAQRGVLKHHLERDFSYHLKLIDTVERLQGGECETIIVSGTQSDAGAIASNADFILDLNRTNVIFSRAQERLIVVCSRSLMDSMPADVEDYASSWLWKHLRSVCDTMVWKAPGYDHAVEVRVPGRFWTRPPDAGRS